MREMAFPSVSEFSRTGIVEVVIIGVLLVSLGWSQLIGGCAVYQIGLLHMNKPVCSLIV
jgi:hypothetical protein